MGVILGSGDIGHWWRGVALRAAYARVAEVERTAQDLVGRLGARQKQPLLERLASRGLVERREDKVLGLFPTTRWPTSGTRPGCAWS